MKNFLAKVKSIIYKIMETKIGKFLFECLNVVALIIAMCFFYSNVNIMLGSLMLFCLVGTILSLIDKYKKKDGSN